MSRQGPALIEQQGPGPGSSKSRYLSRKTCTLFVQAELKQFPRISRWAVVGAETGVSVMQNQVDIDHKHSRAICQEIGERLQAYLRVELELPASLKKQLDQLHQLESQSPSIVPTWSIASRTSQAGVMRAEEISSDLLGHGDEKND